MFTDSEIEPFSNGEYFPSSDEETWDAFRTAVALLRIDPPHSAIKPPHHRSGEVKGTSANLLFRG